MWKSIASDRFIIYIIKYCLTVDFETIHENDQVQSLSYKDEGKEINSEEINKLLEKEVISECNREKGDFVSSVFTRKKKNGNMRTILN